MGFNCILSLGPCVHVAWYGIRSAACVNTKSSFRYGLAYVWKNINIDIWMLRQMDVEPWGQARLRIFPILGQELVLKLLSKATGRPVCSAPRIIHHLRVSLTRGNQNTLGHQEFPVLGIFGNEFEVYFQCSSNSNERYDLTGNGGYASM